jgi:hypothetical protein
MIEQPANPGNIEENLDSLAKATSNTNTSEDIAPVADVSLSEETPEHLDSKPVFTGEEVMVAGKKKVVEKVFGETTKAKEDVLKQSDDISTREKWLQQRDTVNVKTKGDFVITPHTIDIDADTALKKSKTKPTTGEPGDGSGVIQNINMINDSDSLKRFIQVFGEVNNLKGISTKSLMKSLSTPSFHVSSDGKILKKFNSEQEAIEFINKNPKIQGTADVHKTLPYDFDFLAKILDPKRKTVADPTEIGKMLIAQLDVVEKTRILARKVVKAKQDGTLAKNPELVLEFDQMMALAGEISKSVQGRTADVGRSLRMFGEMREASVSRFDEIADDLNVYIKENGDYDGAVTRAFAMLSTDSADKAGDVARNRFSWSNSTKMEKAGWAKDIMFSSMINGYLSSPITHIKNTVGNFVFGALQPIEMATASGIGWVRNLVRKSVGAQAADRYYLGEAQDFAYEYFASMGDSLKLGNRAFKENRAISEGSKIELDKPIRPDVFDVDFGDSDFAKFMSKGLRYYGNYATLPGRALLAEDEFFKGIAFSATMKANTRKMAMEYFDDLMSKGVNKTKAKEQMAEYLTALRSNPPDELIAEATENARRLTFTNELQGGMLRDIVGGFSKIANYGPLSPMLKVFVPFIRTPYNLFSQAAQRTPLGLIMEGSSLKKAIVTGGREADIAMARVGLSSGVLGYFATTHAFNGKITGAGPRNKDQLATFRGTGWQPFSFVLDKNEISKEQMESLRQQGVPLSVGPDKVYVSYAGLQPIGTILSLAATIGEYGMLSSLQGQSDPYAERGMKELVEIGTLAVSELLSEMPVLQGLGEATEVLESGRGDGLMTLFSGVAKLGIKTVTDPLVGAIPGYGPYSSLISSIERWQNPDVQSGLPLVGGDYQGLNRIVEEFYKALGRHGNKIPYYSKELPLRLNPITGEKITVGSGNFYEMFNPFKTSNSSKMTMAQQTLVDFQVPAISPVRTYKGYTLSAQQYNDLITLSVADGRMASQIVGYRSIAMGSRDLDKIQSKLKGYMRDAYKRGFERLKDRYPDLRQHIKDEDYESATLSQDTYY